MSYHNWYYQRRVFRLRSSHPTLVKFTAAELDIPGQEDRNLGIQIDTRQASAGVTDVLVFVNDEEERNEDCFKIRVTAFHPR